MRKQEVWLIDGDNVIIYFASYPLMGTIVVPAGKDYERLGLDIYIAKDQEDA